MPKVTSEHVEARRQQILEAAVTCFSRSGLHEARLLDIAHEAGVSAGTVYHYFSSKDDIIDALRARSESDELVSREDVRQTGEPLGALLELFDLALTELSSPAATERNRVAQHLWSEALLSERILEGVLDAANAYRGDLVTLIGESQELSLLPESLDPLAFARVLHAVAIGLQVQHVWEPETVDFDAVSRAIHTMVGALAHERRNESG